MEANEKIFRHSFTKTLPLFLVVLFLGVLAFSIEEIDYPVFGLAGLLLVAALSSATRSVRISEEEITTSRLWSSKSLRWSDIARVSTRGQTLRLHADDDLVLSIDSQLDDYREILDLVFRKRPDLLDMNEENVIPGNWLLDLAIPGFGLFLIAIPVFLFFAAGEVDRLFSFFLFGVGALVIAGWFLSPKSLTLESRNLTIRYLFKEVSHSVGDIRSISLDRQRTKNGYMYCVRIDLISGKSIKLSGFKHDAPLTYHILKRWHGKATRLA